MARFTGNNGDPEQSLKPDVTFFLKNDPLVSPGPKDTPFFLGELDSQSTVTSFLCMELFVELKSGTHYDPFCDSKDGGMAERGSENGGNTRGQCILYAANQLAYQHRLFAFSLAICKTKVRFFRWDREGAVISAAIDVSQEPELLIEFLRRFDQLTAEQRGLDPTASRATSEQTDRFDRAVARINIESLKLSVGDRGIYPRYQLEVHGPNNATSYYIVGKALDYDTGLVGRCTRGYLALNVSTGKCVFLKDVWRPDVVGVEPEHVWYEKLAEAEVPHLVEFECASDVISPGNATAPNGGRVQKGLTHQLKGLLGSDPKSLIRGRVHYRFVQRELCRPLLEFTNSKELTTVILHSLEG